MTLSLKAELETWVSALKAYDEHDLERALELFSLIADSAKILTNMGLIYATIGDHETAVEHFNAATSLDSYLAIAHFQSGVSNFLLEHYDLALLNFEDAYLFLRGNEAINYEQIGLKFKLFSAEILFNKGLTELNLGYAQEGIADMQEASRQKVTDEHGVIDEAIREHGQGYTVFSIPVGVIYRPSESKIKNSKSKDYLGKAKLVAASDSNDAFTEFTGVKKLQQTFAANDKDDARVEFSLTRSATVPTPRADPVVARRVALERSKTTFQPGAVVRPDAVSALTSRRSQSVSSPANVPPPPLAMNLSRSHSTLARSNTTRLVRSATTNNTVMPLRVKTPQASAAGVAGVGAVTPREDGHFYDSYIDEYTDDYVLPEPTTRPPAAQARSHSPSLQQRQPPAALLPYQQPQPRAQEPNTGVGMNTSSANLGKGGVSVSNGSLHRKPTRRPTVRRVPVYDSEGDDGFVNDELEMANIRVKLHYQGDVRGMTIPPITTFDEFVERVTTKFGTSLAGLGMKFTDEDGTKISLRDESDFELAIETARENGKGKSEGKIEVWCVDV